MKRACSKRQNDIVVQFETLNNLIKGFLEYTYTYIYLHVRKKKK